VNKEGGMRFVYIILILLVLAIFVFSGNNILFAPEGEDAWEPNLPDQNIPETHKLTEGMSGVV
jgi:hypothetical protein